MPTSSDKRTQLWQSPKNENPELDWADPDPDPTPHEQSNLYPDPTLHKKPVTTQINKKTGYESDP